ncbi:hypothetical protein [Nocardia suismassiliense]|uniref:hypothetical protein n=1 Tax=Nocardia suismassiliense TaxID=2077092 RepID=UPI00131F4105|nr:hypothetical protein [Nocardia suismassiliense]
MTTAYAAHTPLAGSAPVTPTRTLPTKQVTLRQAVPTPHGVLPPGTTVAATVTPYERGWRWRLHLSDPGGEPYTIDGVDPEAIRGRYQTRDNAISRAVAFEEYGFARDGLGYAPSQAFRFVSQRCKKDPKTLRDWGFHQLDALPADAADTAAGERST